MKKFFATVMALVMVLSLAVTASAKMTPVPITRYGKYDGSGINKLVYFTAIANPTPTTQVKDTNWSDYEKTGWEFVMRTTRTFVPNGGKISQTEDVIIRTINCAPFQVRDWITHSVGNVPYPNSYEVLSINGRPYQNYIVTADDAVKGGITQEKAQEYLREIKEALSDTQLVPRNAYNSTLPTGNSKMVSLYVGGQVAAYYTANTVKADFFSARPVLKSGVVYVPLKNICSYLGATVNYDSKTRTTKVVQGNKIAFIKTGSKTYILNGQKKTLEGAPYISDGSLMVPISFMTNIGYTVKTFNGKFGNKLKFDIYN